MTDLHEDFGQLERMEDTGGDESHCQSRVDWQISRELQFVHLKCGKV